MGYISEIRAKVGHDPIFMPAVACFILKDNQLLLQLRTDNHKWGAHGGCMEFGETPEETLVREVSEELGIVPTSYRMIKTYSGPNKHMIYPNGDEVYIVVVLFLVDDYEGKINLDTDEVINVEWFPVDSKFDKSEINPPDYDLLMDTVEYVRRQLGFVR